MNGTSQTNADSAGGRKGSGVISFSSDPIGGVKVQSPYLSRDQLPWNSTSNSPVISLSLGTSSYSRKRVTFTPSVYEAPFLFLLGFQQYGSNLLILVCFYYWSYFVLLCLLLEFSIIITNLHLLTCNNV